jgi:hypothetical protein
MWDILEDFIRNLIFFLGLESKDIRDIVFSLVLAIAIAIIISQIYKYTHRGLNYELAFMSTLVLLAPIVTAVMLFIRGDLVLSLGLIGSLSIIRFRTPIKDTRDMVFLFWVIAVGLGCGTYNWNIIIISTMIVSTIVFILHFAKYGQSRGTDYVLVVMGSSFLMNNEIGDVVHKFAKEVRVRSQEKDEEYWEIVFEIKFINLTEEITGKLIGELQAISGVKKVSLLAPQIALPV